VAGEIISPAIFTLVASSMRDVKTVFIDLIDSALLFVYGMITSVF
jgi:hypothetical protein